ncbi:hypothetical protein RRG08_065414 [Elysia crispata]|uniref:Uncharacterized protein n=1 Tax=Elysia crispata TaxID=231223 RepID=A0AAE0ZLD0_9GAST|nr:hypothetical protein RRG08_065414 [Elysia crispata]
MASGDVYADLTAMKTSMRRPKLCEQSTRLDPKRGTKENLWEPVASASSSSQLALKGDFLPELGLRYDLKVLASTRLNALVLVSARASRGRLHVSSHESDIGLNHEHNPAFETHHTLNLSMAQVKNITEFIHISVPA